MLNAGFVGCLLNVFHVLILQGQGF
jgi:hypothetical protein